MSGEVVETVFSKHHKYEVVKSKMPFGDISYSIHMDGKYFKGSYDSLAKAVAAANALT